jgi:hypothetical protein
LQIAPTPQTLKDLWIATNHSSNQVIPITVPIWKMRDSPIFQNQAQNAP